MVWAGGETQWTAPREKGAWAMLHCEFKRGTKCGGRKKQEMEEILVDERA